MSEQEKHDADTATLEQHDHDHDHANCDHDHGHHHHDEEFQFVEEPTFEVDYKGACAYEVKVSIGAANERKKADEVFEELRHEAVVPGFRKGKAPRVLLERRFAKTVRNDVTESLIGAAFRKLIKEQDLRPIHTPDIDGLEALQGRAADAPLEVTLKFEVAPKCELGKYRGIAIERPVLKIQDKDIDEAIDTLRGRFATFETVDGAAEDGDQIIIDFNGTVGGNPIPGGSAENYPYVLGSGRFFEQFEAALRGAKAGQEVTADVPFPEDHGSKDLAGKTVNFVIKVHEVKRKALPALNEEFATLAGHASLAELREKVASDLREGAMEQSQQIAESRAMQQVVEGSTFELPKSLVASAANEYFNQELRRLAAMRVPPAEVDAQIEQLRQDALENATREIKVFTAINEIGEAEGITVTEADFEREAENIGKRTGMDVAVAQRYLAQSEQRGEYEGRIFRSKAIAVVLEHATITDQEVERDALEQEAAKEQD
jgi:trigger factor